MAIDKVKEYFKPLHMEEHILEFDVSSATVELAAEALHCEGKRIAKTMSFLVGEQPILIVTAGDTKIDNAKYRHFFGAKAKMIPGEEVEAIIGHAIGGVCVSCIIKIPIIAEGSPQSCRGNFPIIAEFCLVFS